MKNLAYTVVFIALILAAFIVYHVALPYDNVFTDHGVQLNTVDAYYMVRYAEISPLYNVPDYYINYPKGNFQIETMFPDTIAITADSFGIDVIATAAWLPPILLLLTLPMVYVIARILFKDYRIALLSCFILVILPGEFMYRTCLGAGDRHCLEIFIFTTVMMFSLLAVRQFTIDISYAIMYIMVASILAIVYTIAWLGGVMIIPIIAIFLISLALVKWYNKWQIWAGIGYLGTMVLINPTVMNIIRLLPFNDTAMETQPLFYTEGMFDMSTMVMWYGITFFVLLVGIGVLAMGYQRNRKPEMLLFMVWTIVILVLTIVMRRWAYYLAINIAIITAFVMIYLLGIFKANKIKLTAAACVIVIIPLLFNGHSVASSDGGMMPNQWHECTEWLRSKSNPVYYMKSNNPGYGVVSHWNYGYWIVQQGRMPAYCTPGNHFNSRILVSKSIEQVAIVMDQKKLAYLIIDDRMMNIDIEQIRCEDDYEGIVIDPDLTIQDTAIYQLYYGIKNEYLDNTWQSSDGRVKVFEPIL